MDLLDTVIKILQHQKRKDLVNLLKRGRIDLEVSDQYGSYLFSKKTTVLIYTPIYECEKLRSLSGDDHKLIVDAFLEVYPPMDHGDEITRVRFLVDTDALDEPSEDDMLLDEVKKQMDLMIAVATDGPKIKMVNQEYIERRKKIWGILQKKGLRDPNPHDDLWVWYGKWSRDLPKYQMRREYVTTLYTPLIEKIQQEEVPFRVGEVFDELTGWTKVDRALEEIKIRLRGAAVEEQFQTIGLLCRECLISVAQTVFDAACHPTIDGVEASKTDAKRMLEAYICKELSNSSNAAARKLVKAAVDLANDVQHRRTATFRDAALCAETTTSVVNLIAIIFGRRDP